MGGGRYSEQLAPNSTVLCFLVFRILDTQVGLQIKKNFYSTLKDFMFRLAEDCKVGTNGLDTPLNVKSKFKLSLARTRTPRRHRPGCS